MSPNDDPMEMNDLGDDFVIEDEELPVQEKTEIHEAPWKVMIVDDERDIHMLTRMVFRRVQFEGRPLEFLSAYSGEECERLLEENPDVAMILLDVVMETDDAGFQTVRRIRETLDNNQVRIVLRTGQPGMAPEESVILDYDINDYVSKTEPFNRLLTSVITGLRTYRDLKARRQLDLASALEEHLFTRKFPELEGYDLHARTQSAYETGGDFFEILPISNHETLVVLGDVSGKGLSATLYVSAVLSMIRAQVECFKSVDRLDQIRPIEMLKVLNRLLIKTLQRGKFVTMFIGILDSESHSFRFSSAGHCAAFLCQAGETPKALKGEGMVCGLCGEPFDQAASEESVEMPKGSWIVINSDGLTEANNVRGEVYGDEAYLNSFSDVPAGSNAKEVTAVIWDQVMDHLERGALSDDCTLVCISREP